MLAETQDVLYAVTGAKIVYHPTEGRPSAVTSVKVFDQANDDDSTAETAAGAPSVTTSPDTTIDAASGAGQTNPRQINVAATTGFELAASGQQYLITGQQGESEWVQLAEIGTGLLIAAAPLQHAYVTSDPIVTSQIEFTIDPTWVADKDNISGNVWTPTARWRVQWTYVVGGVTYRRDSYFDLVRYPGDYQITALDVDNYLPGFIDMLPEGHETDRGGRLIAAGWRSVKIHMAAAGKADQLARDTELVDHLVILATIERWAYARAMQSGQNDLVRTFELASDKYESALDKLVRVVSKVPFSTDQSGAGRKVSGAPIWRR